MASGRALLFEADPLVGERIRQMVRAEGFATVLVDDAATFLVARESMEFDLYVVGVSAPDQVAFLGERKTEPLVLLAPLDDAYAVTSYRIAIPGAMVVDRALRDVDALRSAIAAPEDTAPSGSGDTGAGAGAIEAAFAPFELSERQLDVLRCALLGHPSREIAAQLFISELTVRNHLHAIYERVGVSGRRELLGRFVQGLIDARS